MRKHHKSAGFSLLELLAVITIIGILASIILSRVSHHALDAKKKSCLQYKGDINTAVEHFRFATGAFPTDVSDLEGTYYPEAVPKCPVDNSDYTLDPTTGRIQGHVH